MAYFWTLSFIPLIDIFLLSQEMSFNLSFVLENCRPLRRARGGGLHIVTKTVYGVGLGPPTCVMFLLETVRAWGNCPAS